jgi:hypothetical protein
MYTVALNASFVSVTQLCLTSWCQMCLKYERFSVKNNGNCVFMCGILGLMEIVPLRAVL